MTVEGRIPYSTTELEGGTMSIVILLIGFAAIALGYGWYARTIDRNVIQPDDQKATPAKMYMDGVDFTPANRNVLFGYQFKSIAALGPIVGPIVAVRWGWLPALLWIVLGTSFIGWVQDYASIVVGVREEGQTFGALSYRLISPRARGILLIFIYAYLLLIMGAFGKIVGYDLMTNPAVPLGVLLVIVMGLLAGQMTYKWRRDIILTSVVTVVGYQAEPQDGGRGQDVGLLARAIRYAGAGRSAISLWRAPHPSTGRLIKLFYENWLHRGMTEVEALRQAQIDILQNAETRHPHYWAHLVMYDG